MKQLFNILTNSYSSKRFALIAIILISLFGIFHTSAWFLYTNKLLSNSNSNHIGDLVRITCETNSAHPRKVINTLNKRHLEAYEWDGNTIDILTIGDSFSNGGGNGKNRFYQDYIATIYNKKILNIAPPNTQINHIEMIIALYNNGMLDKLKPKIIILESVERFIVHKFAKDINWNYNIEKKDFLLMMNKSIYGKHRMEQDTKISKKTSLNISIINKRNYDCMLNPLYYKYSKRSLDRNNLVYKAELTQDMFSVKDKSSLLFIKESIDFIKYNSSENLNLVNDNLNKLSLILKNKNITLLFLPISDKYDLYSSYIKSNNFPKNYFFKDFANLNKKYIYIDTKKILLPIINSKKDVYFADDTHWSKIASKEVVLNLPIKSIY